MTKTNEERDEKSPSPDDKLHTVKERIKKKAFNPTVMFTCCPCNFLCSNQKEYLDHKATITHKANMMRTGIPHNSMHMKSENEVPVQICSLCNVKCNSFAQYQQHLAGKTHRKKAGVSGDFLMKTATGSVLKVTPEQPTSLNKITSLKPKPGVEKMMGPAPKPLNYENAVPTLGPKDIWCDVCHIVISGKEPFRLHINGNKHKKNIKKHDEGFNFIKQDETEYALPDYTHIISHLTQEASAKDLADACDDNDEAIMKNKEFILDRVRSTISKYDKFTGL